MLMRSPNSIGRIVRLELPELTGVTPDLTLVEGQAPIMTQLKSNFRKKRRKVGNERPNQRPQTRRTSRDYLN
jgi:hypothetical protein